MSYKQADCLSLSRLDNAQMATIEASELGTLGGRVAFLRKMRGWAQADLATHAGFRQPSISELETNTTKEVTARLLWAVAAALETTPEYLWTGEMDPEEALLLAAFRELPYEQRPAVLRAAGVQPQPTPPASQRQVHRKH